MSDDATRDPLADVINMLAAPIVGGIRTFEQFRRGVEELFRAVDNVNRTMENLNEAATRVNRLLGDIEEPLRTIMPQVTRAVKTADEITTLMQGPVRATAPKIERIVDTLGSPGFTTLPSQLGELMARLGPLTQLAESAGGLFGAFRMPGMTKPAASPAPPAAAPERSPDHPAVKAVADVERASSKQPARTKVSKASKSSGKKSAAKQKAPAEMGATPTN